MEHPNISPTNLSKEMGQYLLIPTMLPMLREGGEKNTVYGVCLADFVNAE